MSTALGFMPGDRDELEPRWLRLLGASRVRQAVLRRGGQVVALQQFDPPGAPYPAGTRRVTPVFQHFAMPVADMGAATARLLPFAPAPISQGGPQQLPQRSGGAVAFKFRDPDGHPLELIRLPAGHGGGIDHSAIAVADAERSIAFYRTALGLRVTARQTNTGAEQDALDGLEGVSVDVVALAPAQATPHLELLGYRTPAGRPIAPLRPCDIAATRVVFTVTGLTAPVLTHDPDGHAVVLEPADDGTS